MALGKGARRACAAREQAADLGEGACVAQKRSRGVERAAEAGRAGQARGEGRVDSGEALPAGSAGAWRGGALRRLLRAEGAAHRLVSAYGVKAAGGAGGGGIFEADISCRAGLARAGWG